MNTETFKTVDTAEMQREIDDALAKGRAPATYIPVGNESRAERRKRERIAAKALKKRGRVTALAR